jgi:hypothetical protein
MQGVLFCPASAPCLTPLPPPPQYITGLLEFLPTEARGALLEHQPQWERLLGLLGVPVLTLAGLLARSVVPVLMSLPDQAQVGRARCWG